MSCEITTFTHGKVYKKTDDTGASDGDSSERINRQGTQKIKKSSAGRDIKGIESIEEEWR